MSVRDSTGALQRLYAANTPDAFWRVLTQPPVSSAEWADAVRAASSILPLAAGEDAGTGDVVATALSEALFGPSRWSLGKAKRLYYQVKPFLPRSLSILLRHRYRRRQEMRFPLGWPIEDRYVRFQFACVAHILRQRKIDCGIHVNFWPDGQRFAFVLTHDVEDAAGAAFVPRLAELEERLGFRSSFNFVPERYPVDLALLSALRQRGFEVGVHGLRHDGRLFFSQRAFARRAEKINQHLHTWEAAGFRAPYTHRNPEWMQALDIEYDLSFFDTDPYEPMPGGAMSIWPFLLGSFVELPYTLVQDHTLMVILGARAPGAWLNKVDFVERWRGMALVNAHPDYLREPQRLAIYEAFLHAIKEKDNYWHALPREVGRWWRRRAQFTPQWRDGQWDLSALPSATLARISA
ncbi:MAG TPA: hypothetical protein VHR15_05325 [Ktedonobacterales bacterium]|nr:hypothetical protein [Ktedonobacterales bacterium]